MHDVVTIFELLDHAPYETFRAFWSGVDGDEGERAFALLCHNVYVGKGSITVLQRFDTSEIVELLFQNILCSAC